MRILHTADWHLGKKLNMQVDLIDIQKDLLDQIYKILKEEKIDVFVLAGDIYQSVNVSDEATKLLNDFLKESVLSLPNTLFILINGNHDSAEKLNFASDLLVPNLKIITKIHPNHRPIVIEKYNKIYNFYVIPFIRVYDYNFIKKQSFRETKEIFYDILKSFELNKNHKNILITHTAIDFMQQQERSDSEDDSYGNVGLVPSDMFSSFDLVLLGHYHKFQKFNENIFYSGSIFKYSSKEVFHEKGILIHDLEKESYEFRVLKPIRDLQFISNTYHNIINQEVTKFTTHQKENDYFFIEIHDSSFIPHVKEDLSLYLKHIIEISYKEIDSMVGSGKMNISQRELQDLDEIALFRKFLEYILLEEENKDLDSVLKERFQYTEQEVMNQFKELWDQFIKK